MHMLHIQLLGGFHLTADVGETVEIASPRQQLLLAYLLLNADRPQPRAHIAFLFWPDTSDAQAKANLRRELSALRRRLPLSDRLIDVRPDTLQWRHDGPAQGDVHAFRDHLAAAAAAADPAAQVDALAAAVDGYRGPLLPADYDDWVLAVGEELDAAYVCALEQLVTLHEAQRDYARATTAAQRLLRHDPLYEPVNLQLMRLHALQDDRAGALRVYHTCAANLERELGVEPSSELQALYRRLLKREEEEPPTDTPAAKSQRQSLVGRRQEWQKLLSVWQQVAAGHARLVLLRGEAGIGKTRLAEELLEWVERQGRMTARAHCYAAEGELAYAPITAWLRSEGLRPELAYLDDVWLTEIARLLPELLVEGDDLPRPALLEASWQRTRLFEALARACLNERQPKLFLLDDMQWCDTETLAWLRYMLRFDVRAPLLIIGTLREEDLPRDSVLHNLIPVLRSQNQITEMTLAPLDAADTIALAQQVSGAAMDGRMQERLFVETEGNPLFIVEMVRSGLSLDVSLSATPVPARTLPAKVQAVVQERLGQLTPPAQTLVGLAAAIGRSFPYAVLAAAGTTGDDELVAALDELWQRKIIRVQGINTYDFSHDRIREAAYAGTSPVRRPQLHRRIALALQQVYAGELDGVATQLAMHYEQAGLIDEAIDWHERAASVQRQLHAAKDSAFHLSAALSLLEACPASPAHTQREIDLLLQLSDSHGVAHGLAATSRRAPLLQAREMLRQTADDRRLFAVMDRLVSCHLIRGDVETSLSLSHELVVIAHRLATPDYLTEALQTKANCLYAYGNWAEAFDSMRRLLVLAKETTDDSATSLAIGGADPATRHASVLRVMALMAWTLGYADQARGYIADSNTIPNPDKSPFQYTNTLFVLSCLYHMLEDIDAVATVGEKMFTLGKKYELPMAIASGNICLGWALAHRSDVLAGAQLVTRGVDCFRQMGHTLHQPRRLADLAYLYIRAGEVDTAGALLQEALTICHTACERRWEAEVHRICGLLAAAQQAPPEHVEKHFNRALEVARHQQARALELRAATSLAEYWQARGKSAAAHSLLKPIYDWFTEGHDTHDLLRAADLLKQLA